MFLDDRGMVIKSTKNSNYPIPRFERQIEKQKTFYQEHLGDVSEYKTPFVYGTFSQESYFGVVMELVDGLDPIEFLQTADEFSCSHFFGQIRRLVNEYFSKSEYKEIPTRVLYKKYSSVVEKLSDYDQNWLDMAWIQDFCPDTSSIVLPVGPCHGDLTLSNMILKEDRVILLDFMETYLDSPIQDIVKLRQDTHHLWTLLRYPYEIKNKELVIKRLKQLDQLIVLEWPRMYDWKYETFQFLNLVRILPYATEQKVVDWVFKEIGNIK